MLGKLLNGGHGIYLSRDSYGCLRIHQIGNHESNRRNSYGIDAIPATSTNSYHIKSADNFK